MFCTHCKTITKINSFAYIRIYEYYLNKYNTFFNNQRIMIAIIQEDENSNTSRRRVVESSKLKTILSPELYQEKTIFEN
jgi:hypothetical protein